MATIAEMAHGDGAERLTDLIRSALPVPQHPADDALAANKAFWRLMLAKANYETPGDKAVRTEQDGRMGIWWEGRKGPLVAELWPNLSAGEVNAFMQSNQRYLYDSVKLIERGFGSTKSMFWIADEFYFDKEAMNRRVSEVRAKYRKQVVKKEAKKMAPRKTDAEPVEAVESLLGVTGGTHSLSETLMGMAKQYEVLEKREKLLNQRKGEILAYLEDVTRVVREL